MPIAPEYLHLVHPDTRFDALIYGRASRDPKKKGRSVGDQIDSGRDLCDTHNWPIAEVFDQDVDRSASRHARKARKDFEALLEAIAAGKGRIVVAWEASRYYRDIEAYIRLRNACMENSVLLCYNGQVFDLSKREDRKATAQDAIAAEDEAEGIRDRVLRTTRAQAKKGAPHGRILWGYARHYDPDTGDLIEQYAHPERGPVVESIFERIAAGDTEYAVLKDLRAKGERLPGIEWEYYHLSGMLRNPGYIGRRIHQGKDVGPATWPPLVKKRKTWDAVQRIIGDPARARSVDTAVKHLQSGIATCGECADDPPLRVLKNRGDLSYQCDARYDTVIRRKLLDAYVEEAVIKWLGSKAAVAAFQSTAQEKRAEEARERQRGYESQLEEARERASTFKDGRPLLSVASLASMEARLEPLIEAAKAAAEESSAPALVRRIVGRPDVESIWNDGLSIEQRRTVLRAVVNVRLYKARVSGVRSIEPGRIKMTFVGEPGFVRAGRRGSGPALPAAEGS
ncbi:recombinase family protein [Streptomyces sp. NPDC050844]|uniref:recombinase family protein n=1 Tax=Streptomyces sp. NPDC050844 TaxID=3155790 RepID=UPI0033DFDF31